MIVCKFGGTSVASAEQIKKVFNIVTSDPKRRIVAVSAPGKRSSDDIKVTDLLIDLADSALNGGDVAAKIEAVVKKVYGGDGITVMPAAKKQIESLTALGFDKCPVCIAKTQYSFSDDPTKLGAPDGFKVTVKNVKISAGAGFIVVLTGDILTMPGLPKIPAAEKIDVDENGKITGLF